MNIHMPGGATGKGVGRSAGAGAVGRAGAGAIVGTGKGGEEEQPVVHAETEVELNAEAQV